MSSHPTTTNEINITGVKLRNKKNPRISAMDRDKRKSEVLIAAQSLDNEIQSVKNLKRLSIGSLDLLIDPELEFRVNNPDSNKRKSWIAPSNSISPDVSMESNETSIDSESFTNSSIDITRAEYIHDEATQQELLKQEQSRNSSLNSVPTTSTSSPTTRHLTGINSLRRGLQNVGSRRTLSSHSSLEQTIGDEELQENNSNNADDDDDDDEPITNNLLWVPANQHPNVKPENYIELVQDTLHNIQIQDSSSETTENLPLQNNNNITQDKENRINRGKSDKKYNRSLVRRPSSLRKSYSKLTESSDNTNDEDLTSVSSKRNSSNSSHSTRNQRTASLKDITEELTKISNNAGLTNSDAITLARTLSMAGSFTGIDDEALLDDGTNNEIETPTLTNNNNNNNDNYEIHDDDDNTNNNTHINSEEFASKMFMKNGLTIPQRSSLRRSKFNTYRIRSADSLTSSSSSTSPPNNNNKRHSSETVNRRSTHDNNNRHDTTTQLDMPHSPIALDHESPATIGSVESPGSISDLYDHYTQLNKGSRTENEDDNDDDTDEIDTSGPASQDSSLLSNDSVLYRPTQSAKGSSTGSLLHENTDNLMGTTSNDTVTKLNSNTATVTSDNWSWSGKSERNHSINNDMIDNTRTSEQTTFNLKNRSNHSKNRHKPIFNISNNKSNNPDFNTNNIHDLNKKNARPSLTKSIAGTVSISNSSHSANSSTHSEKDETVHTHAEPITQVTTPEETKHETVVTQKKPSLEEKLVNLFKRKTHRRRSSGSNNQPSKSNESGVQEELKKKISKFRKHQKKQPTAATIKPTIEITPAITEKQTTSPTSQNEIHEIVQLQRDDSQLSEQSHSSENTELPTLQPAVSVTSTKNREPLSPTIQTEIPATESGTTPFTETVHELDGDDSQDVSGNSESLVDTSLRSDGSTLHQDDSQIIDQEDTSADFNRDTTVAPQQPQMASSFPPRKLTFADVKRPEKPNAPIQFTDSAFGFPLPELTNSTVIMFDHRLGINVERAIYRLSHLKLSDSKRELRQQVLLSNFMYSYLNLVNHTLYMEQSAANTTTDYDNYNSDELEIEMVDNNRQYSTNNDTSNHYESANTIESSNDQLIYGTSNSGSNMEYTTEHNNSNGTILIPEI